MRILVITATHTFPHAGRPHAGLFFANLLLRLKPLVKQIAVVCPTAYIPAPLLGLRRFARQRLITPNDCWNGIDVYRPHYFSIHSHSLLWAQARSFSAAAFRTACRLREKSPFDVVIGYGFGPAAHAAQFVAKSFRKRAVSWAIGTDVHAAPQRSPDNFRLFAHNVRYNDMVLTESEDLRLTIMRRCRSAHHVHTYYKGIDLACLKIPPTCKP